MLASFEVDTGLIEPPELEGYHIFFWRGYCMFFFVDVCPLVYNKDYAKKVFPIGLPHEHDASTISIYIYIIVSIELNIYIVKIVPVEV